MKWQVEKEVKDLSETMGDYGYSNQTVESALPGHNLKPPFMFQFATLSPTFCKPLTVLLPLPILLTTPTFDACNFNCHFPYATALLKLHVTPYTSNHESELRKSKAGVVVYWEGSELIWAGERIDVSRRRSLTPPPPSFPPEKNDRINHDPPPPELKGIKRELSGGRGSLRWG